MVNVSWAPQPIGLPGPCAAGTEVLHNIIASGHTAGLCQHGRQCRASTLPDRNPAPRIKRCLLSTRMAHEPSMATPPMILSYVAPHTRNVSLPIVPGGML